MLLLFRYTLSFKKPAKFLYYLKYMLIHSIRNSIATCPEFLIFSGMPSILRKLRQFQVPVIS